MLSAPIVQSRRPSAPAEAPTERKNDDVKRTTLTAAAVAATLVLAACGGAEEPAAPAEETQSATPTEEATEVQAEADADPVEYGDGVWPEGYSFELPADVRLQDELVDPAVEGTSFDEELPPYRRMTINGKGLAAAPDEVWMSGMDAAVIDEGLLFAGQFMIEHVLDSPWLLKEYDAEAEAEWIAQVDEHLDDELVTYLHNEYPYGGERTTPFPLSLGMLTEDEDEDEKDDGVETLDASKVLYDEGGARTANVEIAARDITAVPEKGRLEIVYESSQVMLITGIGSEGDEEGVYGLKLSTEYGLTIRHDGESWKVWGLNPSYRWTWDKDIEPAA